MTFIYFSILVCSKHEQKYTYSNSKKLRSRIELSSFWVRVSQQISWVSFLNYSCTTVLGNSMILDKGLRWGLWGLLKLFLIGNINIWLSLTFALGPVLSWKISEGFAQICLKALLILMYSPHSERSFNDSILIK